MTDSTTLDAHESSRYASRKFLLALGTLICAFVAFALQAVTAAEVIDLTKWVLGLYFAGNVGARLADAIGVLTGSKQP